MKIAEQLAYAAGLIDGDGSITLSEVRHDNSKSFLLSLTLRMNMRTCVEKVAGVLPGSLYFSEKENTWRFTSGSAMAAKGCMRIQPFLLSKRKQADLALAFHSHVHAHRYTRNGIGYGGGSFKHPKDVYQARLKMSDDMKRLHATYERIPLTDHLLTRSSLVAYAAGLMEAEGSFMIVGSGRGVSPRIAIQMTDPLPLDRLSALFGGNVRKENRKTKRGKDVFVWTLESGRAAKACKEMIPYLVGKHEQASILVRFQNNVNLWRDRVMGKGSVSVMPERVSLQREAWRAQVKYLNSIHKRAGAETNSEHSFERSDSPSYNDGKVVECDRNDRAVAENAA